MFDLDGVLLDSEGLWDQARREVVARQHGRWREEATSAMQGMSSPEWSSYMRDELAVPLSAARIVDLVVENLLAHYRASLPLVPGSKEAVERIARRWPLALASSSNRVVIDEALARAGLRECFDVTVSSEEVPRGKPAPDVYLECARRLGQPAEACAAVEDSATGILAALAAGLAVVAIPNRDYPPPASVLRRADVVIDGLPALTPGTLDGLRRLETEDWHLDEEEVESFPASDPHSDWAGPDN